MSRNKTSWGGKPSLKYSNRPRGLQGREIGMYYKNLKKQGIKPEKHLMMNLSIPPTVISILKSNIKSILKTAAQSSIDISPFDSTKFIKKRGECDTASQFEHDFLVPKNPSKTHLKSESETSEDPKDDSLKEEIKTEPQDQSSLSDIKIENVNYEVSKQEMHSDEDDKTTGIEQLTIMSDIKTDENSKEQSGEASHTLSLKVNTGSEDIISVKSEHVAGTSGTSPEHILSVRGTVEYKYSYEDITTGTFDEKLDECISKGITISQTNAELENLSVAMYEDYKNMQAADSYRKMKAFREKLPTYKKNKELLEVIDKNQVVVISGETGCGKSTQVPQIILDNAIENKKGANVKILVTQPRRIAASSLAMRVSQERAEKMGASVGYAVRLEKVEPRARGSILFCTTGILLVDLEMNQALTNYSHIILDEVHERDCHIDMSMYMLKKVLQKRKDLKLILMSATVDADTLTAYYDNCPLMHIEGLAYPVRDIYLEEILQMTGYRLPDLPNKNINQHNTKKWMKYVKKKRMDIDVCEKEMQYKAEIGPWSETIKNNVPRPVYETLIDSRIEDLNINLICELLICICKGEPGAILVFLPGISNITKLMRIMNESHHFPNSRYEIYPIHSKLPSLEQHKIFEKPPSHIRKIVIATNIAETSITIDDIVYVVDCGKIKYSGLNIEDNVSTLDTQWVSQANLKQRRGRAGRCQPGICYHVITSYRASKLEERLLPELQRCSLLEPLLTLKRLRLGKCADALKMMPAPPADNTVRLAVKHLQQIGAFDFAEKLTPLGWHLARLPVHPAAGKLLLLGSLFGCLDRAASVAAVWGFKDPFQLVIGKEQEVDMAKRDLTLGEPSDHVAISEAIIQWEQHHSYQAKRDFAYNYFLSMNTMEQLSDMKRQFADNLKNMGFLPSADITAVWENRNRDNLSLFKAIVAASLYPNIAITKWINLNVRNPNKIPRIKVRTPEDGAISLHPSSVMASRQPSRNGRGSRPVCVRPEANWLVYWFKQRSTELFLFDVTLVYTLPLLFFGELEIEEAEDPADCLISISTVKVCCKRTTTEMLCEMRTLLDKVLASKIGVSSTHSVRHSPFEENVLNAVIELITAEDERAEYIGSSDQSDSDNSEFDSHRRY